MSCFVLALHMLPAFSLSLLIHMVLESCRHPSSFVAGSSLPSVDHSSIIEFSLHTGNRERKHTAQQKDPAVDLRSTGSFNETMMMMTAATAARRRTESQPEDDDIL
uniref:Putative secreted protein n=1 Tax=Anopheles triannulatus TaxID=58253 RepID=A0A2M4B526_9DIPT